jgi:hypothetical protein
MRNIVVEEEQRERCAYEPLKKKVCRLAVLHKQHALKPALTWQDQKLRPRKERRQPSLHLKHYGNLTTKTLLLA